MELRHLRYFVAVAEEQNVTRAAARLHISQPPLTRQIQDLEQELGLGLFRRSGRSIRLTEAGRQFLADARDVLARVDEAVRAVRRLAGSASATLHLGYAPTPAAEILPPLLREFSKRSPRVRVALHDHSSPEMLAGLREGRLHAAIMMQPPPPAPRGITFARLAEYPLGVAVPLGHAFSRKTGVAISEVLVEPTVVYSRQQYPDYHALLRRVLGRRAKQLRVAEECDGGPSLLAAVASGKGIAIVPSVLVLASGRRVRFVPLVPAPAPAVVGIAYRANALPAHGQEFVEAALAMARG